jgi:hypothetical protein
MRPSAGPVRGEEAVEGYSAGFLTCRDLDDKEAQLADGRAKRETSIAEQLKNIFPPGQRVPRRLEKGEKLIAKGILILASRLSVDSNETLLSSVNSMATSGRRPRIMR